MRRVLGLWAVVIAAFAGVAPAHAAVARHAVVVRAAVRDPATLSRLLRRTKQTDAPAPALHLGHAPDRSAHPKTSSSGAGDAPPGVPPQIRGPLASAAYTGPQRPFPIFSQGYLDARSYDPAIGRLYALGPDQQTISACTATVVDTDLVVTAAHCVVDLSSGLDDTAWAFVPGMQGNSQPYGVWTASYAGYYSDFPTAPMTGEDYAFVVLDPNQAGQDVGSVTGTDGFLYDASPRRFMVEGYPASGPFASNCSADSCDVWYCFSPLSATYTDADGGQFGIGCKSGHGASGGPWFAKYQGKWYVDSVTSVGGASRHPRRYFRNIWGAQFDDNTNSLFQDAQQYEANPGQ